MRSRLLFVLAATLVCWLLAAPVAGAAAIAAPRSDGTTQVGIVVLAPPGSGGGTTPPGPGGDGAGGQGVKTPPGLAATGTHVAQLLALSLALLLVGTMLTTAIPRPAVVSKGDV